MSFFPTRLRRLARIAARCALAGGIVLLAAHLTATWWWGRELRALLATAAAAGVPMRVDQVVPATIAPAEDAAPDYLRAFARLVPGDVAPDRLWEERPTGLRPEFVSDGYGQQIAGARLLPKGDQPEAWPPGKAAEVMAAFESAEQAPFWTGLAAAAARPHCRFPIAYDRGPAMPMPHLMWVRHAQRLMLLRIRLLTLAGRSDEAWEWVPRMLRMARHVDESGLLITRLVAMSIEGGALDEMRVGLERSVPPARTADELAALLAPDDAASRAACLDVERVCIGDWSFIHGEALSEWSGGGGTLASFGFGIYHSPVGYPLWLRDRIAYNRLMLAARSGRPVPAPDRLALLTRLVVPALDFEAASEDRLARSRAVAIAALAVATHRRPDGSLPARLAELPTAIDPRVEYRSNDAGGSIDIAEPPDTPSSLNARRRQRWHWRLPARMTSAEP